MSSCARTRLVGGASLLRFVEEHLMPLLRSGFAPQDDARSM